MRRFFLLSSNAKLDKAGALFSDIVNVGLSLAPWRESGHNVCASAGFCRHCCVLRFAGRQPTSPVRNAAVRRTQLLFDDRPEFMRQLRADLDKLAADADSGKRVFFRPDTASDMGHLWCKLAPEFPNVEFYGYTKRADIVKRVLSGDWPSNYPVTYSWSERVDRDLAAEYLAAGHNVSVVFSTRYVPLHHIADPLPWEFLGHRVIDGDTHDLRHPEFDGSGVIVGLRFKGSLANKAAAIKAGFCVEV